MFSQKHQFRNNFRIINVIEFTKFSNVSILKNYHNSKAKKKLLPITTPSTLGPNALPKSG